MIEALQTQVGGDHYKRMKIQPAEYILANGLGKYEGDVIEKISRWKFKGGVEDLKKAQQAIQIIIDYRRQQEAQPPEKGHQATVAAARNAQQEAQRNAASKQAQRE